jgi:hypothetical protein
MGSNLNPDKQSNTDAPITGGAVCPPPALPAS